MITEDYKTIKPGDMVWEDVVNKLIKIPDDVENASKIEYIEDNPTNEGGDVSFLFQKIFGGNSYIECYFTFNTDTCKVEFARDISDIWDITSDGKEPNTYCAVYIGNNVYVAVPPTARQKTLYLIGALNKEEYEDMMEQLPEDLSLEEYIEDGLKDKSGGPFISTFVKPAN